MRRVALMASILIAALVATGAVRAQDRAQSATIIGTLNPQLANGAIALDAGRIEEGIQLTLEGLELPAAPHDKAAGYANLCAGYALLKQWDEALQHCNTSLSIDKNNWRAFNNRAAIYTAKGQFESAIADIHAGLEMAPKSHTLLESLRIVQENKRAVSRPRHGAATRTL